MKNLLTVFILIILFSFTGTALAQSYGGFNFHQDKRELIQNKCLEQRGVWKETKTKDLPKNPLRVTSGGTCIFSQQVIEELEDTSYKFVLPKSIVFVFDHVDQVESAIFEYDFQTWAARDHAKKSFKIHMHDLFLMPTKLLSNNFYELKTTDFYLELLKTDFIVATAKTVYRLGIGFSREQFYIYSLQPETEAAALDVDFRSNDPLQGL